MSMAASNTEYSIYPVSKDLAIVSMNMFYKFYDRKSEVYGMIDLPTTKVSDIMSFGDPNIISGPHHRNDNYIYEVKRLSKNDVIFNNKLLLNEADNAIAFFSKDGIIDSIKVYEKQNNYK